MDNSNQISKNNNQNTNQNSSNNNKNELNRQNTNQNKNQRNNSSNKQSLSQRFQKNETKNLEVGKINNNEKNENLVVDINKQNDLITNPKTKIVNKQFSKPIPRPNFNQNQKPKNQGKQLNQSSQTNSVKANSNVATEKRTQQNPNNSDKTQNKQINEKRNSHQSRNNSQSRNSDLKSNSKPQLSNNQSNHRNNFEIIKSNNDYFNDEETYEEIKIIRENIEHKHGDMSNDTEMKYNPKKVQKIESTKGTLASKLVADTLIGRESNCEHGCGSGGNCNTGGCGTNSIVQLMLTNFEYKDTRRIIEVEFRGGRREFVHVFDDDIRLKTIDKVIVEIDKGLDYGTVSMTGSLVHAKRKAKQLTGEPLPKLIRKASDPDIANYVEIRNLEREDRIKCQERVKYFNLDMHLFDVEWQFDKKRVTFFYTADGRVDFRELVKDLANIFRARIELRQVPPRDEAKRLGTLGICGKELCCTTHLSRYEHITLEHAKYQMLQPNPQKLSGQCGRLKCCLLYEVDNYIEGLKKFPPLESNIRTEKGEAIIQKIDIFRDTVTLHYLGSDQWETISLLELKKYVKIVNNVVA